MQTVKIFLASSSELKDDRDKFKQFLYDKTIAWKGRGIFLEIIRWEEFLDNISQSSLQDEYNEAITEADIFVMLFFTKVGKYTEEEFETAFKQFKATNKPIIYTYFKDAEITTGQANKNDLMSMWSFQERLNNIGHYYTTYKNSDELLWKFGQQLDKLADKGLIGLQTDQGTDKESKINYRSYISQLNSLTASNTALNKMVQDLAGRLEKYDTENRLTNVEDSTSAEDRINKYLREIIDRLPPDNDTNNISRRKTAIIFTVTVFVLLATGLIFFNRKDITTSVTVFVHGKEGRQDLILRQKGFIIMNENGEQKKEDIDDKGKAVFQNVFIGDKVPLDVDFSEPYHPVHRDSLYLIKKDSPIYLEVQLENLDRVYGSVTYNNMPLENVTVSIDTLRTNTDSLGYFEIRIPEQEQRQRQQVTFNKPGFKTQIATAYPEDRVPLPVTMEKN
jgi:hypothetical protein